MLMLSPQRDSSNWQSVPQSQDGGQFTAVASIPTIPRHLLSLRVLSALLQLPLSTAGVLPTPDTHTAQN